MVALAPMNRREFFKTSTVASGSLLLTKPAVAAAPPGPALEKIEPVQKRPDPRSKLPDLSPARWIWFRSVRTLQNTFVLFRRELQLQGKPRRATGWICADSRYRLEVNANRVQRGPPPCDPRWAEADPLDLAPHLREGPNVIGATVLFYGTGDGTWPLGKAGFLFWLEIEHADGHIEKVVSDASWKATVCRAWNPGRAKRWYLRALQEEFDARLYPYGWCNAEFKGADQWPKAMLLNGSPQRPALSTNYYEYTLDPGSGPPDTELRPRSIPLLKESFVSGAKLSKSFWLRWDTTPRDYFDFRVPEAFKVVEGDCARESGPGEWTVELDGTRSAALTFELKDQIVGWPGFTIEAPAGTEVELLVHEAHAADGPPLLNTHFDSWTRFICAEGANNFETFDFESLRWLQLHIHNARGMVKVRDIRVRRRVFPWPHQPLIQSNEPGLQRLWDACLNTLNNSAQETLVDGMARERQQYSGDGGQQLHGVHLAFGEPRLVQRYLTTWSQGLTKDGFFLDCWPAYDRLARLIERQFDLTGWGPILDHGVGFNFDCWSHYLYTGDLDALWEPYPRLIRFAGYLQSILGKDGLLPVENIGIPSVWIDHVAYKQQRHKQCAFNLYTAAAMQHALAPMCRSFGDHAQAEAVAQFGAHLQSRTVQMFWSSERSLFVNNLPWLAEEKTVSTCDRSLATSVLFDQCPDGHIAPALKSLAECPAEMGFSYPANAGWRLWALAKGGRADVIVSDFRQRWATMASVRENNTLQEDWQARPDSSAQWSHCAVVPLYLAYHGLLGLKPLAPGFKRFELRPQLADLAQLDLAAFTVRGPLTLHSRGPLGAREVELELPAGAAGELVVPEAESIDLPPSEGPVAAGHRRYCLPPGQTLRLALKHV
jgi:alpha-L-rhamnosidase